MKKLLFISSLVLIAIIMAIIGVQGNKSEDNSNSNKTVKVGLIINGRTDDRGWNQSHYEGLKGLEGELNITLLCRENVKEDESSLAVMNELIEEGCKVIICNSYGYGKYEQKAASLHPEVFFYHATGDTNTENMVTYFGRMYQIRYLTGIVAGLQTETNQIGYVAAMPIPEVIRGINAFALGVQRVNKQAKVYVEWVHDWNDDKAAVAATDNLLNDHDIDVLTLHSDSFQPLELAEKRGIWTIGYNLDNSKYYPKTFLTAAVWNWRVFYREQIKSCLQGKFKGGHYWEESKSGIITLSPLTDNVKPGIAAEVAEVKEELAEGNFDVFYGPIYDNSGSLRVKNGESMSDETLLKNFDWLVRGVEGDCE